MNLAGLNLGNDLHSGKGANGATTKLKKERTNWKKRCSELTMELESLRTAHSDLISQSTADKVASLSEREATKLRRLEHAMCRIRNSRVCEDCQERLDHIFDEELKYVRYKDGDKVRSKSANR